MKRRLLDYYCTPKPLARKMVRALPGIRPKYVADFAVGDGTLLRAAKSCWRGCKCIAVDIRPHAVKGLRQKETSWEVVRCDFLSDVSRQRIPLLRKMLGRVDLILLNPPFSYRGNSYCIVSHGLEQVRCSRAMAFLINSLAYLSPTGSAVAVLPRGCLASQRDVPAWRNILKNYDRRLIALNGRRTFRSCSASTVLLRLKPRRFVRCVPDRGDHPHVTGERVILKRGRIQMHLLNGNRSSAGHRLIHTTDLRELEKRDADNVVRATSGVLCGPGVLVPRVGRPDASKIVVIAKKVTFVLSDCVLCVCCSRTIEAQRLQQRILSDWKRLEKLYGGTGAPYITLSAFAAFLRSLGYSVASRSSAPPKE